MAIKKGDLIGLHARYKSLSYPDCINDAEPWVDVEIFYNSQNGYECNQTITIPENAMQELKKSAPPRPTTTLEELQAQLNTCLNSITDMESPNPDTLARRSPAEILSKGGTHPYQHGAECPECHIIAMALDNFCSVV